MTNERMLKLVNDYINNQDLTIINELKQGIEDNIRTAANKKVNMNLARSMNNILKSARKERPGHKTNYGFYHNEWLVACDGYRFIQTKEPIELETTDEPPLNIDGIIEKVGYGDLLIVPTIQELNAHIKIEKAKMPRGSKVLIDLPYERYPNDSVTVNAEYLKDMLTATNYEFIKHEHATYNPIEFTAKTVYGILLPIRKPE